MQRQEENTSYRNFWLENAEFFVKTVGLQFNDKHLDLLQACKETMHSITVDQLSLKQAKEVYDYARTIKTYTDFLIKYSQYLINLGIQINHLKLIQAEIQTTFVKAAEMTSKVKDHLDNQPNTDESIQVDIPLATQQTEIQLGFKMNCSLIHDNEILSRPLKLLLNEAHDYTDLLRLVKSLNSQQDQSKHISNASEQILNQEQLAKINFLIDIDNLFSVIQNTSLLYVSFNKESILLFTDLKLLQFIQSTGMRSAKDLRDKSSTQFLLQRIHSLANLQEKNPTKGKPHIPPLKTDHLQKDQRATDFKPRQLRARSVSQPALKSADASSPPKSVSFWHMLSPRSQKKKLRASTSPSGMRKSKSLKKVD